MLKDKKIILIGGSSGIGLETAKQALHQGSEVIIASRSAEKLHQAQQELGNQVKAYSLNTSQEQQVQAFFEEVGQFDHLVLSAAETSGGPFLQMPSQQARQLFENKFWGQYFAVKYGAPKISPQGSIVLFSGIVAYKSMTGSAVLGAVNSAVSSLGQTLALELAPIRVNIVSPGIIDTPSRSKMPDEARTAFYTSIADKLPVKRVGTAADVAAGVLYLLQNEFVTGTVLHVEGGHLLA